MILHQSLDGDLPDAVLGPSTDETLGTEASTQKVNTAEPLPALTCVRAHARLECQVELLLLILARGLIFITLDWRAKVRVDGDKDILDGNERVGRGMSGIWKDCEQPGEVTNAKGNGAQGRGGGGRREDGWGEAWVGMRGRGPHIVLQTWRCKRGMDVHAWSRRWRWDEREGVCIGAWGWCVGSRMRRRMSWGGGESAWEGRGCRRPG